MRNAQAAEQIPALRHIDLSENRMRVRRGWRLERCIDGVANVILASIGGRRVCRSGWSGRKRRIVCSLLLHPAIGAGTVGKFARPVPRLAGLAFQQMWTRRRVCGASDPVVGGQVCVRNQRADCGEQVRPAHLLLLRTSLAAFWTNALRFAERVVPFERKTERA